MPTEAEIYHDALTQVRLLRESKYASVLQTHGDFLSALRIAEYIQSRNTRLRDELNPVTDTACADDAHRVFARVEQHAIENAPRVWNRELRRRARCRQAARRDWERQASGQNTSSTWWVRWLRLERRRGVSSSSIEDRRRRVSICAWGFALTGLFIALGFLVAEFFQSIRNPALIARLFETKQLDLPVVTFCTAVPALPAFAQFPNDKYSGPALFGVRLFQNTLTGDIVLWPNTHIKRTATSTVLGPRKRCERQLSVMSLTNIKEAMSGTTATTCHACFQIGVQPRLTLSAVNFSTRPRGAVRVQLSLAREIAFCLVPTSSPSSHLQRNLLRLIKKHSKQLVLRQVLQLRGTQDVDFALDNAFNTVRRRDGQRTYQIALASFLCNVYFASGYFYPKPQEADIRYLFDFDTEVWHAIGRGPYHNVSFRDSAIGQGRRSTTQSANSAFDSFDARKELENINTYVNFVKSLLVFAKDPTDGNLPRYSDRIGALSEQKQTAFLFSKSIDGARVVYDSYSSSGSQYLEMVPERFYMFDVVLDFLDFRLSVISRQATTSVAEFIADIFEYAGLFTGICAYSLLVGPARMYLRRSNGNRGESTDVANAGEDDADAEE